jgi:hypothetical protein
MMQKSRERSDYLLRGKSRLGAQATEARRAEVRAPRLLLGGWGRFGLLLAIAKSVDEPEQKLTL